MAFVLQVFMITLHITLISPLILTSGAPEYDRLDFNRHPDPVGATITTCHNVKTKQFCLEKLHAYLFSRRCPDAQHNSKRCAAELRASELHKQTWRRPGTRCAMTGLLLLLLSGDVSLNPGPDSGPRNWKYPCGTCQKPVRSNQRGLQCDSCGLWSHLNCLPDAIHVTLQEYDRLSSADENWYCYRCQLPAFSDSFFSITPGESDTDSTGSAEDDAKLFPELWDLHDQFRKNVKLGHLNLNSLKI